MRRVVFYSWQSDLPNPTNRGFIQDALESAVSAIASDNTVAVEPVVDRDTQGVAGAPDIASTIFAKITAADVFVADISIISHPKDGRPTPNPNVLIELGYALRGLGHERVILVFNQSFGKIEELPFDLRTRRLMVYNMPADNKDRATEKKKLEGQLDGAIRAALGHAPTIEEQPSIPALSAIENNQPNKILVLRRNLDEILKKLKDEEPPKFSSGGTVDDLITAIDKTQEPIAEFSKIAEAIAVMNDKDIALETYRWFGKIFEYYHLPEGYSGRTSNADCDYFKFVGYEMFVTLIAFLLREQRWDTLGFVLRELIPVRYLQHQYGPGTVEWEYASEHIVLLLDENSKRRRVSVHADILKERHTTGGLATILPIEDFIGADFFLFLFGELPPEQNPDGFFEWRAWSTLYLSKVPMFIRNMESARTAEQVTKLMRIPNVAELKKRLNERMGRINKIFNNHIGMWPIRKEDIDRIGTR